MRNQIFSLGFLLTLSGCQSAPVEQTTPVFYAGADLSYVNEMEDCGARFRTDGKVLDPVQLFADAGANLVRVRLWHNPDWTDYSDFDDVAKTIRRAKQAGTAVLLDFHYSDTWADPEKQYIPHAWRPLLKDTSALAQTLYDYTYKTLEKLHRLNLTPDMVQIGNETNNEILQTKEAMKHESINWSRNAALLDHGLQAVADFNRDYSLDIQRMLHIAQPENALEWFVQADQHLKQDYDLIGISYYGKWSEYDVSSLGDAIAKLRQRHGKPVMVVETAYPWTLRNFDQADNVLSEDSLLPGYPATPDGQLRYLSDLADTVKSSGGIGVVYWAPAWVSTSCKTLWGTGSHWENASMFDPARGNEALPAMQFFSRYGSGKNTL